jgi:hypothetical protein
MESGNDEVAVKRVLQYADEVLCANWNPFALLLAEKLAPAPVPAVDGGDVDAFLARLYCCQRA